ncbi:unnamed protein product [Effrenium voratum]|nr:unnamed protein product [Effrenium voratum]
MASSMVIPFTKGILPASTRCISTDIGLQDLEVIVEQVNIAAGAVDALAADSVGGFDAEACDASMEKLRKAAPILTSFFPCDELSAVMDETEAALRQLESQAE